MQHHATQYQHRADTLGSGSLKPYLAPTKRTRTLNLSFQALRLAMASYKGRYAGAEGLRDVGFGTMRHVGLKLGMSMQGKEYPTSPHPRTSKSYVVLGCFCRSEQDEGTFIDPMNSTIYLEYPRS